MAPLGLMRRGILDLVGDSGQVRVSCGALRRASAPRAPPEAIVTAVDDPEEPAFVQLKSSPALARGGAGEQAASRRACALDPPAPAAGIFGNSNSPGLHRVPQARLPCLLPDVWEPTSMQWAPGGSDASPSHRLGGQLPGCSEGGRCRCRTHGRSDDIFGDDAESGSQAVVPELGERRSALPLAIGPLGRSRSREPKFVDKGEALSAKLPGETRDGTRSALRLDTSVGRTGRLKAVGPTCPLGCGCGAVAPIYFVAVSYFQTVVLLLFLSRFRVAELFCGVP